MSRLSNIMQVRRYQLLFIAMVISGIYYPALSAGFCTVDDLSLIQSLTTSKFSWSDTFMPGNGFYYRPLLKLTYRFDQWAWGVNPSFMHLENILIHLGNTLLVYAIATRFFRCTSHNLAHEPLLAATLFGLHPLGTESVNWISGRTDPLGSLFVLLGTLALFHALRTGRYKWLVLGSLLTVAGAMAKEVMIFFFPAGIVLIGLYPHRLNNERHRMERRKAWAVFCLPPLLIFCFFLTVRWGLRGEDAMDFAELASRNHRSFPDLVRIFFKVWGFYVKKLFWPMPLNFALTRIGNQYVWLGIAGLGGLLYMTRKNSWLWAPWIMAGLLLVPTYFIGIANMTWTPLAERYAYLATAFWAIGMIGLLSAIPMTTRRAACAGVLILLLIGSYAFITAQRNRVWQDNLLLFADTVTKSPEHIGARNELGNALLSRGRIAEAKVQFEAGLAEAKVDFPPLTLNLAHVYLLLQKPAKAREILLSAIQEKGINHASLPLLNKLALADEYLIAESRNLKNSQAQHRELRDVYELIYEKTNNPAALFRSRQLALTLDN